MVSQSLIGPDPHPHILCDVVVFWDSLSAIPPVLGLETLEKPQAQCLMSMPRVIWKIFPFLSTAVNRCGRLFQGVHMLEIKLP